MLSLVTALSIGSIQETWAQSCETSPKKAKEQVSNNNHSVTGANSGCTLSACRGAKTKFGEAKIITDLRLSLIDLKSMMENHEGISFDPRSYDIHGIVGETDEESLQIIKDEIEIIQKEFSEKLNKQLTKVDFPKNKAKQVSLLQSRLSDLKKRL
ncbi:hypothetical protein CLV81_0301 [Flagellimonas meridianipacifica]|uniref:Uncharacterized protein n=2 Tax=Flagellimonas meridianipacifica TaxID=1080225 RepID=A0A2T0MFJ2_9FLAO|nr:hypothetical protein CLV81_0301 [Allomuricauda pacifica]